VLELRSRGPPYGLRRCAQVGAGLLDAISPILPTSENRLGRNGGSQTSSAATPSQGDMVTKGNSRARSASWDRRGGVMKRRRQSLQIVPQKSKSQGVGGSRTPLRAAAAPIHAEKLVRRARAPPPSVTTIPSTSSRKSTKIDLRPQDDETQPYGR
jgi:hypothetical protein